MLEAKSPAEFFANNKTLTGFDNATKALYTTVREFVENALDAAEAARVAPAIAVTVYAAREGRARTGTADPPQPAAAKIARWRDRVPHRPRSRAGEMESVNRARAHEHGSRAAHGS